MRTVTVRAKDVQEGDKIIFIGRSYTVIEPNTQVLVVAADGRTLVSEPVLHLQKTGTTDVIDVMLDRLTPLDLEI